MKSAETGKESAVVQQLSSENDVQSAHAAFLRKNDTVAGMIVLAAAPFAYSSSRSNVLLQVDFGYRKSPP